MWIVSSLASLALIAVMLVDAFETILQPRRVMHRFRFARLFYRNIWKIWRFVACSIHNNKTRESFLGLFGPLSLLGLFATWVAGLIFGFAILHWSIGTPIHEPDRIPTLGNYLYLSGTTFFTLGYGDVTPLSPVGRVLAVIESGLGFAFLAVIIGYLPSLSQAFSRREVQISLLDAHAGSPPSAAQMLLRLAQSGDLAAIDPILKDWEQWAAELLESHLSFPVLGYYRSQHDNQNWVAALATILDTCAFLIAEVKSKSSYHARFTFAMARHAAVDLSLVLKVRPKKLDEDRFVQHELQQMKKMLAEAGLVIREGTDSDAKFAELRGMYEPFINALAQRLMFFIPEISPDEVPPDNWQRSPGMRTPGIGNLPAAAPTEEHFG